MDWVRGAAERPTLRALALLGALTLGASLAAALGGWGSPWVRLGVVLGCWTTLGLLLAYTFLPGVDLPWRVITRAGRRRRVALTFDDGPHGETTPAILEALAAAQVRATFFLVGSAAERRPDLVRRIVAEGHAVGNHTQRHRILPFRTVRQLEDEVGTCQRALAGLGAPVRLFRPPHGFKPVGLHRILARHGLRLVAWQGAIRDTDAPGVEAIVERAVRLAADGRILLLHDSPACRGQTAAALAAIVARYRARGYDFVTLESK